MKTDLVVGAYVFDKDKVLLIHHKKRNTWLPVGGHIEKDETTDHAIRREVKEETGLDIELLNHSDVRISGTTVENLASPFYVNVHNVGDHNHCCFFYLAKALNPTQLKINNELNNAEWFTEGMLLEGRVPDDVCDIGLKAFDEYRKIRNP